MRVEIVAGGVEFGGVPPVGALPKVVGTEVLGGAVGPAVLIPLPTVFGAMGATDVLIFGWSKAAGFIGPPPIGGPPPCTLMLPRVGETKVRPRFMPVPPS